MAVWIWLLCWAAVCRQVCRPVLRLACLLDRRQAISAPCCKECRHLQAALVECPARLCRLRAVPAERLARLRRRLKHLHRLKQRLLVKRRREE